MDRNTTQMMYQKEAAPVSSGHRTVGDITLEEWKEIVEPTEDETLIPRIREAERALGRSLTMGEKLKYAFHGELPSSISTETALDAAGGDAPMTQEEALKRIVTEYPEAIKTAMVMIKDNEDLVEFLSVLDSY